MNSSLYVGAPLVLPIAWAVAAVVTLVWIPWRAISSWGLWSSPTSMASVGLCQGSVYGSYVGIWTSHAVTQLRVHSFAEVHSLVEVACHCGISVPSVQSCCIWSNGNPMWGNLFSWLGAVVCNWGSPWRVQVVCDHYHCNWCWLLDACHGRLHPQVWSCGRLVLGHAEWHSGSWQCQLACKKVSWMVLP